MIIDDKIRDEKLQYDINREAATISALSSGKNDKYEYLTDEEILPSDRSRIINKAKFTYSPLSKAFEKQIKTIEDQGEKQMKPIKDNKKELDNKNPGNNKFLFSKQREIFKNIFNERLDKIDELSKKIDYNDLKYTVSSTSLETDFSDLRDPVAFLDSIKKPLISIEEARYKQEEFDRYLKKIRGGNKSDEQKKLMLICFLMEQTKLLNL